MEPITYVLGALSITLISGIIGKFIGSNGKVKDKTCTERRSADSKLINEKLHSVNEKLDIIIAALKKNNFLGI